MFKVSQAWALFSSLPKLVLCICKSMHVEGYYTNRTMSMMISTVLCGSLMHAFEVMWKKTFFSCSQEGKAYAFNNFILLKYMLLKHACIWSRFFYTCPHVKAVLNYSFLYSRLEQFEDIVLACRQPWKASNNLPGVFVCDRKWLWDESVF